MLRIDFNHGWKVAKEGNSSQAQPVTLPHDAMVHEARDEKAATGAAGGYFPGGSYLYTKKFAVSAEAAGESWLVEFEGAYLDSYVYLNKSFVLSNHSGNRGFVADITPYLRYGQENLLEVTVRNDAQPNSRWYTGSGLYRPVWLYRGGSVRIAMDGVRIATPEVEPEVSKVTVAVSIENRLTDTTKVRLQTVLKNEEGETACEDECPVTLFPGESPVITRHLYVRDARLWTLEEPNLYTCEVRILREGTVQDETMKDGVVKNETVQDEAIENDVSEENDSRFGSTSPWLSGMEGSIYENPVDAGEEEQDISVSSPGWVEENIAELFRNMGSSLIELLQDNMGASIDSIIYGRVGSGRPDSVNIYAFELRKGNPYGVTAAVCYSLLRGMMFVFLGVHFVFQLAKAAWSGQTAKSREEIKAQLPMLLVKFCAMMLMPHLLDAAIYIRDVLLYGIKEVTGQMVTGGATLSLPKAFLINAERSGTFVDAVMYLGTVVLTIYFVFLYVAVAIDMLVCFVSFPFICVLHGRKRDLIGSWVATVFSNLMTPVVDAVLLLVPLLTSLMLSDVVRGVAVIQLVMCMLIIPARIRFKALLGIQSNDRNGFLGAMAVMTFARALASGVKRGAGRIADAVSDARRSRAHGELAEADREEEAALLSSDTGRADGGRAAERPEGDREDTRMPEDMAGDGSRMPEGTDWDAQGESALYEGESAAMDMDYGYSEGALPEEGYGESGAGGSTMEMAPEYSEEPQPEEGYSESAVEGPAMDTAPGHSEELQPEESYRESVAEGPTMDTASVYSGEPQPEEGHKESAAGDMPRSEAAGTGQPGSGGHGGTARAAEGGAPGNTGDARIEALREADRKVESSQNALDRLRMNTKERSLKARVFQALTLESYAAEENGEGRQDG